MDLDLSFKLSDLMCSGRSSSSDFESPDSCGVATEGSGSIFGSEFTSSPDFVGVDSSSGSGLVNFTFQLGKKLTIINLAEFLRLTHSQFS